MLPYPPMARWFSFVFVLLLGSLCSASSFVVAPGACYYAMSGRKDSDGTLALANPQRAYTWSKFDRQNDLEFRRALFSFRGTEETHYDPRHRGGEGQLFLNDKKPGLTLKRFFRHSELQNPWEGVLSIENARLLVEQDRDLREVLWVAAIYQRGSDWILRDFDATSVPLSEVFHETEARHAFKVLRTLLKDRREPSLKIIRQYLERPKLSPNVHWSPTRNKVFIIDLSRVETALSRFETLS